MATSGADLNGRVEPQISANDLALYMVSSETSKLSIIRRNKYPSKHPTAQYQDAKRWLSGFLADDARDKVKLATAIDHFKQVASDSSLLPSKQEDAKRSIQAIEAFFGSYNALELGKLTFRIPKAKLAPLKMEGVKVSVTLDLLSSTIIKGVEHEGGVIWRLTMPEDSDGAREA